jgi:hypothetical protein
MKKSIALGECSYNLDSRFRGNGGTAGIAPARRSYRNFLGFFAVFAALR